MAFNMSISAYRFVYFFTKTLNIKNPNSINMYTHGMDFLNNTKMKFLPFATATVKFECLMLNEACL